MCKTWTVWLVALYSWLDDVYVLDSCTGQTGADHQPSSELTWTLAGRYKQSYLVDCIGRMRLLLTSNVRTIQLNKVKAK